MSDPQGAPLVLIADDAKEIVLLCATYLEGAGFRTVSALTANDIFSAVRKEKPHLILLDILMPVMDGYSVCAALKADPATADIPVIFVTALGDEKDRLRAFSSGASGYVTKPFNKDGLVEVVRKAVPSTASLAGVSANAGAGSSAAQPGRIPCGSFAEFKRFLLARADIPSDARAVIDQLLPDQMYAGAERAGLAGLRFAKLVAEYMQVPYVGLVDPEQIELGILPIAYSLRNHVLVMSGENRSHVFVLSNPFNLDLLNALSAFVPAGESMSVSIAAPETILALMRDQTPVEPGRESEGAIEILRDRDQDVTLKNSDQPIINRFDPREIEKRPMRYITNQIIHAAIQERASDLHIEPKRENTIVRFRIDGDLKDYFTLKNRTGSMLISRLKAMADMNIAERRKPQDGTFEVMIQGKSYKLRLSTTLTPEGESMVMRLLYLSIKPKELAELGMTTEQSQLMYDLIARTSGLVLVVGPTGAGKTTTVYSMLSTIDTKIRSLMSIEDPVEYRMPHANQHQVNDRAGITFESLLKSVVRQDPDVVFLGEIRDAYSAKASMDLASTGHMILATLHSSNATTSFFRMERLGIGREMMSDSIACIIAQRLLKKLCPYCKSIGPINDQERAYLQPFTVDIPERVARPVGCPHCENSGYMGREGVYETLRIDPEISAMIRSNRAISDIRNVVRGRGGYLISNHALSKIASFQFAVKEVYEKVLVEELDTIRRGSAAGPVTAVAGIAPAAMVSSAGAVAGSDPGVAARGPARILVVDDDRDLRVLLRLILESAGFEIEEVSDGVEAILELSRTEYDLIVSDINMPNIDGFKLIELLKQKNVPTPVIFLSGEGEDGFEAMGLRLGAEDYIHKPISDRDVLVHKVRKALGARGLARPAGPA